MLQSLHASRMSCPCLQVNMLSFYAFCRASDYRIENLTHRTHFSTRKINGNRSDGDPVVNCYKSAVENRWTIPVILQVAVCSR
jgi:hypothetical protein